MNCLDCGRPIALNDALFCNGCGARLPDKCPICGQEVLGETQFARTDGSKLSVLEVFASNLGEGFGFLFDMGLLILAVAMIALSPIASIGLFVLFFIRWRGSNHSAARAGRPANVEYRFIGHAGADVYCRVGEGQEVREANILLPWRYSCRMKSGDFAYVAAWNREDHGHVSVAILVNGLLFKSVTSRGPHVIAEACGTI